MNGIRPHDFQVLADYRFSENGSQSDKLIGLKLINQQGKWIQQLVEVNRQDVTCWTLFLSLFGQESWPTAVFL